MALADTFCLLCLNSLSYGIKPSLVAQLKTTTVQKAGSLGLTLVRKIFCFNYLHYLRNGGVYLRLCGLQRIVIACLHGVCSVSTI